MIDFIFNVIPSQGPVIPQWIPIIGGMPASAFAGSFLGVALAFAFNWIWQTWNSKRLIFEEEYYIKAELSGIAHDLRVGGRPEPIRPIYGADHVRKYRLFGEYRTQVIYWYEIFQKHNVKFENFHDNYPEILRNQESIANQIVVGHLRLRFMKRIPDDLNNSGLSKTKFLWYLLNQDALDEPTRKGDFRKAAVDAIGRSNDRLANLDYQLTGGRIH
jgi:hypothetical protein